MVPRSNLAAAAAAAACVLSMSIGPQHASLPVVSAFAPSNAFIGAGRPVVTASSTAAWSSVAEAPTMAEAAPAPAAGDKPKKKKRRKSTKFTPKASANGKSASASPKNGKRAKNGKSFKSGKRSKTFKRNNTKRYSLDKYNRGSTDKSALLPLSALKLGQKITGYVAAITDFGAFVKTPYKLEGGGGRGSGYALLHISQISDERVNNVTDVLEVGQELQGLRVVDINYAKGEVGLSLRTRRPPRFPLSIVRRGEEMEGKVTSVVPYGAFVDVGCKVNALLHVSRMSTEEVKNIEDAVKVGQYLKVRIIDVDKDKRTLACSILDKKADEYFDRRKQQMERKAQKAQKKKSEGEQDDELKTELAYFEEALQELENAFK